MRGLEEESDGRCAELKVLYRDERLIVRGCSLIVLRKDAQAAAGNLKTTGNADLEVVQLNFGIESGAKGFNDAAF